MLLLVVSRCWTRLWNCIVLASKTLVCQQRSGRARSCCVSATSDHIWLVTEAVEGGPIPVRLYVISWFSAGQVRRASIKRHMEGLGSRTTLVSGWDLQALVSGISDAYEAGAVGARMTSQKRVCPWFICFVSMFNLLLLEGTTPKMKQQISCKFWW